MRASIVSLLFLLTSLPIGLIPAVDAAEVNSEQGPALYERMGGYDVIAASVDNFLERYDNDPELMKFLGGVNAAESARIRQHFVDYLCQRTGGPCFYLGRDMVRSHEGLAINDADYDRVMRHLDGAFTHAGIAAVEKQELLSILEALRPEIINR